MSKQSRLERLEKALKALTPVRFMVYMRNENGLLERWNEEGEVIETLTPEQFEALPGQHIHIAPASGEEEDW